MAEFAVEMFVNLFHAAALDSSKWDAALEALVRGTRSFGAVLFPMRGALPYVPASRSMENCFDVYVRDGWVNRDERSIRGTAKLIKNGVITDRDIVSEREMKRSPFYQEFLPGINLKEWVAVRVGTGENVWSLTLHRTSQQEPFPANLLNALHSLSVQLGSTAEVAVALGAARGEATLAAFDVAGKAALLLNRTGEIVRTNQLADTLFDKDISIVKRRLFCSDKKALESFDHAIRHLLWSGDQAGVAPISLPRPGRSPVIAYVIRSFQLATTPLSAYHAIVVLVDPETRFAPALKTLQSNLDLTPAEARLAIALQAGNDLQAAAKRLNVTHETVRKQLRSTFMKTGLSRQSDLIALLSNLLPDRSSSYKNHSRVERQSGSSVRSKSDDVRSGSLGDIA